MRPTVAFILEHGGAKVLLDRPRVLAGGLGRALADVGSPPLVVDIDDASRRRRGTYRRVSSTRRCSMRATPGFEWSNPDDEWRAISLNYTSGTTGNPKGVVYHHRGAYLNALSNIVGWNLAHHPVYLWTLPMFHCNGWCFPWALAAVGRDERVHARGWRPAPSTAAIAEEGVTHMCGAPVVLGMILNAADEERAVVLASRGA